MSRRRSFSTQANSQGLDAGPRSVANLALVHAWTGERDRALEQLESVAKIPAGPTYDDLRFNPCWDSLRGDPRFDKIVAAAKAAKRICFMAWPPGTIQRESGRG